MEKVSKVLTYGALKSICKQLENQVSSLKLQVSYLKKEGTVQHNVIQQLKKLCTTSHVKKCDFRCDNGHQNCKIRHGLYNFIKSIEKNQDQEKLTCCGEGAASSRHSAQVDELSDDEGLPVLT